MLIAERILKLRRSGSEIDVPVRIFAPEQESERGWKCQFEINWPDDKKVRAGGGVDAVQALVHALCVIASSLYTSPYHASGDLYFDKPGGGYGFPVVGADRDLLVGDDATFF
jgi:Domain of unknown function (DUF6968)